MDWVANKEPLASRKSVKQFTKIDGNTTSYSMTAIKEKRRMQAEQVVEQVLKNLKLKILGQPAGEMLLTTDKR